MSLRYKGGVISATPPTPSASAATGVWTLEQQLQAEAAGNWPSQPPAFGESMRSLRFNSPDSAYLNRTPASAGDRRTWTISFWYKRGPIVSSDYETVFSTGFSGDNYLVFWFRNDFSNGQLQIQEYNFGVNWEIFTTATFRDPSSWYHFVLAFDSTQATASNRFKLYINGQQYAGGTPYLTYPTQNYQSLVNSTNAHAIGRNNPYTNGYLNGYLTEYVLVDGQALTPSSFGQTNSTTGVWEPKAITGLTYGTNGFYLTFQDNSGATATTLGKDSSGNGNNWTPNNFSVTAGVGNDSLVDTPYPYGTDTGAGGEVRGNYATWNPLRNAATLTNGNLDIAGPSNGVNSFATVGVTSGKWYWEVTIGSVQNIYYPGIGVNTDLSLAPSSQSGGDALGYMYLANGQKFNSNSVSSYGASFTTNDVIGVALDMDAGTITFYKNGSTQGQAFSGITGTAVPVVISWTSSTCFGNFGQRPFAYTAPSGFKALCTQNLSTPTVVQGDDYFNPVLYTGNGTSQSITGLDFSPDLVWTKSRSNAYNNTLVDSVRGVSKALVSDLTAVEDDSPGSYVTAFNSNGFSVGTGTGSNGNGATYVGWAWRASDSAPVSNTQGALTGTVSANATAGFSIVTWAASGTYPNTTLGHGLGATPAFIITKSRNNNNSWRIWHKNMAASNNEYYYLGFDNSAVGNFGSNYWVAPTSTIFGGQSSGYDNNVGNMVAYVFAPVAGFSAFGSYTGNGSTNGPFIYTGFRPAFVLVKRTDTTENWVIFDNKRDAYNLTSNVLLPNSSQAESSNTTSASMDLVSNGIKIRASTGINSGTWIYAAFAENPFKYALAR